MIVVLLVGICMFRLSGFSIVHLRRINPRRPRATVTFSIARGGRPYAYSFAHRSNFSTAFADTLGGVARITWSMILAFV